MKNKNKKIQTKANRLKFMAVKAALMATTMAVLMCNASMIAFAEGENGAPVGVQTDTMDKMVSLVFWIVRILVLLAGGAPGIMKIVQGQSDENPRDRNNGIATLGVTGAAFGASFLIEGLL